MSAWPGCSPRQIVQQLFTLLLLLQYPTCVDLVQHTCHAAGVPHLLQQKWHAVAAELQAAVHLAPFSNRVIRLNNEDEAQVAPLLTTMADEWGREIAIGSYPVSRL